MFWPLQGWNRSVPARHASTPQGPRRRVHQPVLVAYRGRVIESLQQRAIEIDVPALLRDEKCRCHGERAAAHVSDHELQTVPRCLVAQCETLGQATALVELDVDVSVATDERRERAAIAAGLIGGEWHRGMKSVEGLIMASSHRLLDQLDTEDLQLRQQPLEE